MAGITLHVPDSTGVLPQRPGAAYDSKREREKGRLNWPEMERETD